MKDLPNIEDVVSLVDEHIEDDDELDLVKLVSTDANDSNQYLLFLGSDNQYYAKNVSKIEELLVYKDLDIAYNNDKNSYILGTANIRGKMTSIVNFDKWIGNEVLDDSEYELVIIASYGGRRFALVVKEVEYITTIDSKNMTDNSEDNSKASFISKVSINGKDKLCTIFDSDLLLLEVFDNVETQRNIDIKNLSSSNISEKIILFADDSKFIRKMMINLFQQMGTSYEVYNDGEDLIKALPNIDPDDIGLIITDLEMPGASGREVIDFIRKNEIYNNINILVHTNMSNDVMENELKAKNVAEVIGKIDMLKLSKSIKKFMI
jgi:two-component system chemotaxis response regulator CheV